MKTYYLNGPSQECVSLEASETENLFHLMFAYRNVQAQEKADIRNGKISFKMIRENNYIMLFVKIGRMKQEIIFDPTLYGDHRALKIKDCRLEISLIDITTQPLRSIEVQRTIEIPQKLKDILFDAWQSAMSEADFSTNYTLWYHKLQTFTTNQLFDRATYVGKSE